MGKNRVVKGKWGWGPRCNVCSLRASFVSSVRFSLNFPKGRGLRIAPYFYKNRCPYREKEKHPTA
ncbi:hypothetical protein JOC27_000638 [Sporolactobacillus spathodeae]|uniref:Uncharacterized protein n=1 Tax=Sporolactobacillus spathodeae TaxID=1465502 RepID=A0ABS2Q5Y2_9BACL|nr:hypothetical protein [Sporolactobacillus spathodeae]